MHSCLKVFRDWKIAVGPESKIVKVHTYPGSLCLDSCAYNHCIYVHIRYGLICIFKTNILKILSLHISLLTWYSFKGKKKTVKV
ncbi:hypothetical protein ACJIZ3_001533 [Penstemon smallii]|uniref:Uncharacterized protein n=1 Tax=Penstemon smallii TaxID=265156 RepID=A0ABD3U494_9LAMI